MSKSIFEISAEALELTKLILEASGEITPAIELALAINTNDAMTKIDSYQSIMERCKIESEYWDERKKECDRMKRAYETVEKKLKDNIKYFMVTTNVDRLEGFYSGFSMSQSPGALVIDDLDLIPEDYKVETITYEPNKPNLKAALLGGKTIPGAHIEYGQTLRKITVKKGIENK